MRAHYLLERQKTLYRLEINKEMKLNGLISPRAKIQSKIVKATTGLKNSISEAGFPISDFVFNNAIAFDPADSMFDPNPQGSMPLVDTLVQVR